MSLGLALRRLHRLPPSVARQLFISTVAAKIDYAASVWCSMRKDTQAIVGVSRTTALAVAEAEAGIEPTIVRLRARIVKHWITYHTLPKEYPSWFCRAAAAIQEGSYPSPFKVLAKYRPQYLSDPEIIRPFPLDPWQRSLSALITTVGSSLEELYETGYTRL